MPPRVKPSLPAILVSLLAGALAAFGSACGGQGGGEELRLVSISVDTEGRVRGTYDATEPGAIDSLRADLGALLP